MPCQCPRNSPPARPTVTRPPQLVAPSRMEEPPSGPPAAEPAGLQQRGGSSTASPSGEMGSSYFEIHMRAPRLGPRGPPCRMGWRRTRRPHTEPCSAAAGLARPIPLSQGRASRAPRSSWAQAPGPLADVVTTPAEMTSRWVPCWATAQQPRSTRAAAGAMCAPRPRRKLLCIEPYLRTLRPCRTPSAAGGGEGPGLRGERARPRRCTHSEEV